MPNLTVKRDGQKRPAPYLNVGPHDRHTHIVTYSYGTHLLAQFYSDVDVSVLLSIRMCYFQ
jgi:hypothetical protein